MIVLFITTTTTITTIATNQTTTTKYHLLGISKPSYKEKCYLQFIFLINL